MSTKALSPGAGQDEVRRVVRSMLAESPSFSALPDAERRRIAGAMVKVLAYLSDPIGHSTPTLAEPLAGQAADKLRSRLAEKQKLVGQEFKAGAAREGAQVFRRLVDAVDFSGFVSGLVNGVYKAVVKSSMEQMEAYGKLLENVVKSVDEFAKDNFSLDQAREFLAQRYPQSLKVERSDKGRRLTFDPDQGDAQRGDMRNYLGLQRDPDFEDPESELSIVQAAQIKMAQIRQQQLAAMVALGINRIVVTDGEIKASVMFDMHARDKANRESEAGMNDEATADSTTTTTKDGGFFAAIFGGDGSSREDVTTNVSSAYSNTKETSSADLEAKAKLAGSVLVRFKSETFPLERLATLNEVTSVQQKTQRATPGSPAGASAGAPAAPSPGAPSNTPRAGTAP